MKKSLIIVFLVLIVMTAAGPVFAEGGTIFPWKGDQYTVEVTHLIVNPVLPDFFKKPDHLIVMVLMESLDGEIPKAVISEEKGDFIFSLQDAEQAVEYQSYLTITHESSKDDSSSKKDSVAIFGYAYDLGEQGDEALENAKLLIATEKKGERISVRMDLLEPIENVDVAGALEKSKEEREEVETEENPAEDEPDHPFAEFAGTWQGNVPEMKIDLVFTINEDGTGSYRFTQNDYTESYDVTLEAGDQTFRVELPEKNALNIVSCDGTYEYDGEFLTLHVVTKFATGRKFSYSIDCERVETSEASEPDAEPKSDECADVMGIRNVDEKTDSFELIDLNTNEKIAFQKLIAEGKAVQMIKAFSRNKPLVLMFFDASQVKITGEQWESPISNLVMFTAEDEICYSLEDGVLTILEKRE